MIKIFQFVSKESLFQSHNFPLQFWMFFFPLVCMLNWAKIVNLFTCSSGPWSLRIKRHCPDYCWIRSCFANFPFRTVTSIGSPVYAQRECISTSATRAVDSSNVDIAHQANKVRPPKWIWLVVGIIDKPNAPTIFDPPPERSSAVGLISSLLTELFCINSRLIY